MLRGMLPTEVMTQMPQTDTACLRPAAGSAETATATPADAAHWWLRCKFPAPLEGRSR
jgi:hypothetical protein